MSEEIKNENTAAPEVAESTPAVADSAAAAPADASTGSAAEAPVQESALEAAPAAEAPSVTAPQVIVQRERGFAHYVGFALLCVLCIAFFFMPGIALTYAVNLIPGVSLGAVAAWIFSAILSVIVWFIFKLKIKGFKKSFYFYIGLCVVVLAILIAAEVLTENTNVFSSIFALLAGAA